MFRSKFALLPCLLLLAAFESRPAVIFETESISVPIVPVSPANTNFPIFVPDFNTKIGTLNSVHIMLDLVANFTGSFISTGGPFDPIVGFVPTPLQYEFTTLPIFLYAKGIPVNIVTFSGPSIPIVGTGPGAYSSPVITTPAISNGSVPSPFFSAFESTTFPATLTLAQTGTLLSPLSPYVVALTGHGTLEGFVQVEYDYTPFLESTGPSAVPEPAATWLLPIGLAAVFVIRRSRCPK